MALVNPYRMTGPTAPALTAVSATPTPAATIAALTTDDVPTNPAFDEFVGSNVVLLFKKPVPVDNENYASELEAAYVEAVQAAAEAKRAAQAPALDDPKEAKRAVSAAECKRAAEEAAVREPNDPIAAQLDKHVDELTAAAEAIEAAARAEAAKLERTLPAVVQQADAAASVAFLDDMFNKGRRLIVLIHGNGNTKGRQFIAGDDVGQIKYLTENLGYNAYFSINPVREGVHKKAKKTDITSGEFLWVDLDPRNGEPLATERIAILASLTTSLPADIPRPNRIVDSGRGYWAFWRLATPLPVDGYGPLTQTAESYNRGIEQAFGKRFADDSCNNIDRVARLPGMINKKTGNIAKVLHEFSHNELHAIESFPRATEGPGKSSGHNNVIIFPGLEGGPAAAFAAAIKAAEDENLSDGLEEDIEKIRSAVAAIPITEYTTENGYMDFTRGFAHEAARYPHRRDVLEQIWDTASQRAPSYDKDDNLARFQRYMDEAFNRVDAITIRTIFRLAEQHGWQEAPDTATAATGNALVASPPTHNYPAFQTAAEVDATEYPEPRWTIEGLIMECWPQTLDGDGGIGKSIVAEQMVVSVTAGAHFMGRATIQSPAIYISHEDDAGEVKYNMKAYAKYIGADFASLPIQFACWPGEDITLAEISDTGAIRPGPFLKTFEARLAVNRGAFVVLDCLSDVMQGNLFLRPPPNAFYKTLLQALCARYGCTLLVLAHPSKTAMSDGSGYEGGTGNKSALRNKLRLELADQKQEDGPRWLSTLKRNRRRAGGLSKPICLVFSAQHETFVSLADPEVHQEKQDKFEAVVRAVQRRILNKERVTRSTNSLGITPEDIAKEVGLGLTAKEVVSHMKWAETRKYLKYIEGERNGRTKTHYEILQRMHGLDDNQ